jgi:hypothetical protein
MSKHHAEIHQNGKADPFRLFLSIILPLMVLVCGGVALAFNVPRFHATIDETMSAHIHMSDPSAHADSAVADRADIGLADTAARSTSGIMSAAEAFSPNFSAKPAERSETNDW